MSSWGPELPDEELPHAQLVDHVAGHRPCAHQVAAAIHDLQAIFREVVRVSLEEGNDYRPRDGIRHVPVRPEDQTLHFTAEYRRAMSVSLPYDYVHGHANVEILVVNTQTEFRDVHHDGSSSIDVRQPAPALQGPLHLFDPAAQRYV